MIEEDPKGNFSSPSIAEWSEDTVKVGGLAATAGFWLVCWYAAGRWHVA